MGVVFVLVGPSGPATTPAAFADFAGEFAGQMAAAGGAAAYEVWNEPDEPQFWGGPVDVGHYTDILRAAAPRIRRADPAAKVLLGALTGNNYGFLGQVYDRGGRGSFDAVAVHTDTACLVEPPSAFQREAGKIGRFSFLGFRTVREVMVANGDGDKAIWMTELGWSTATSICGRGTWTGQKPAGVSEAQQAANLTEAYHCLAAHPYVETGLWFTLSGLRRRGRRARPLRPAAHRRVPEAGLGGVPPLRDAGRHAHRTVRRPRRPGHHRDEPDARRPLRRRAVAARGRHRSRGRRRVTFRVDGRTIRNFTGAGVGLRAAGRPGVAGGQAPGAGPSHADRRRAGPAGDREQPGDPHHPRAQPALDAAHPHDARSGVGRRRWRRDRLGPGRQVRLGEPVGQGARRLAAPARRALAHGALGPPARRPAVPGDAAARAERGAGGSGPATSTGRRTRPRRPGAPCTSSSSRLPRVRAIRGRRSPPDATRRPDHGSRPTSGSPRVARRRRRPPSIARTHASRY